MDGFSRFVLLTLGVIFAAVGLLGLLAPKLILDPVHIALETPSSLAEMRAAYGGTFLGLSTLAFLGWRHGALRQAALTIFAVVLGTFSGARALGLLLDGKPNTLSVVMHLLENVGFLLAAYCLRQQAKSEVSKIGPGQ